MPLSDAYQDAALDALVGTWPDPGQYRLFDGDPDNGGAELVGADGGVAKVWAVTEVGGAVAFWDYLPDGSVVFAASEYAPAPHAQADWSGVGTGARTATVTIGSQSFTPTLVWRERGGD